MNTIECKIKPYIKPFEILLAIKELTAITNAKPHMLLKDTDIYTVRTSINPGLLADNLTYWECISFGNNVIYTSQVIKESSSNINTNLSNSINVPKRRVLRYGSHNFHEYRGKFFPQLVKSLLNIANSKSGSNVLDNMCGSGTTLVEAITHGCNAYGLDMNPLSVLLSRAKCSVLYINPKYLKSKHAEHIDQLNDFNFKNTWLSNLDKSSDDYLNQWFLHDHLIILDKIISLIHKENNVILRDLYTISLSNILRKLSYQKEDDLRVRRECKSLQDINPVNNYIAELDKNICALDSYLPNIVKERLGSFSIKEGDSRTIKTIYPELINNIDVVITSPPYATALPYLDTDRLSLYFLNLLSRRQHRKRDIDMIGNREIPDRTRVDLFNHYQSNKNELPKCIRDCIDNINKEFTTNDVGFRRKNLPSLLSKYFFDMKQVVGNYKYLVRKGGHIFIVIGNNHTTSGSKRIYINTDEYLSALCKMVGLKHAESIPMDTILSRDIFKNNKGTVENILHFINP